MRNFFCFLVFLLENVSVQVTDDLSHHWWSIVLASIPSLELILEIHTLTSVYSTMTQLSHCRGYKSVPSAEEEEEHKLSLYSSTRKHFRPLTF